MTDKTDNNPASSGEVIYHYIKSPQCIDIPVHGAYGGVNKVNGIFYMAIFAERAPIPQEVHLVPDPETGQLIENRIGKTGMIRSVSAVLHYDINAALAIQDWLDKQIKVFKEAHPGLIPDKVEKKNA